MSSTGQSRQAGPSDRLPFLVRFWASKNEHKKIQKQHITLYMNLTLFITNIPA